jgi:P22_AR N-terminal domain
VSDALVKFDFRGDELDVVRLGDGDVGVPLRRLCEVLGLDAKAQRSRLQRQAAVGARWAVGVVMTSTGSDGKSYSMLILPRRSIPMWAASVDASRVRPKIREKLVAYQNEAADVLAERFLPKPPPVLPSPTFPEVRSQLAALLDESRGALIAAMLADPRLRSPLSYSRILDKIMDADQRRDREEARAGRLWHFAWEFCTKVGALGVEVREEGEDNKLGSYEAAEDGFGADEGVRLGTWKSRDGGYHEALQAQRAMRWCRRWQALAVEAGEFLEAEAARVARAAGPYAAVPPPPPERSSSTPKKKGSR